MNILIDLLPDTVNIGGRECPINTDFRASVLFELMMQESSLSDKQKTFEALKLYYPKLPPVDLFDEAVNRLLWFYCGGKREKKRKSASGADIEEEENYTPRIYSFEYDAEYIYAAFLSQYRIDLQDIENFHWWKFKALFNALDENCQFCKIMKYRSTKISDKMTDEQKSFYRKMKRVYALPQPKAEQERQDAITQALLNGGDLTGLL